jgi:hypothetical protein
MLKMLKELYLYLKQFLIEEQVGAMLGRSEEDLVWNHRI